LIFESVDIVLNDGSDIIFNLPSNLTSV